MASALLISAHPDDMEIGMGGTAAKLLQNGQDVISIILTDGRRGPNPDSLSPDDLAAKRREEAQKASAALGLRETVFFDLPDVIEPPNYDFAAQRLAALASSLRPEVVYTLHPQLDRHPTHQAAGRITLAATADTAASIWAYEVWGLFAAWDRLEDISAQIELKRAALQQHTTQISMVAFADGVIGLNRWRAVFADPRSITATAMYAEAFIRLR